MGGRRATRIGLLNFPFYSLLFGILIFEHFFQRARFRFSTAGHVWLQAEDISELSYARVNVLGSGNRSLPSPGGRSLALH
jgi:hypothetical protein